MYVFDSNILIDYLKGSESIKKWADPKVANNEYIAISIVSRIEVLSAKEADQQKLDEIKRFLRPFHEIELYGGIADLAASIRRKERITLADAVVLATALSLKATLVTNDKVLSKKAVSFVPILSI